MENKSQTPKIGMFQKYLLEISEIIDEHQGEFFKPSPITGVKEIDDKLYYEHKTVSLAFNGIWDILRRAKEGLEA